MIVLDHPWTADGQRQAFRAVLEAWSRPGTIADLAAWSGGARARTVVLACLCDAATTLHDAHGLLADGDRSRLGARPAAAGGAGFLLVDGTRPPEGIDPARGSLLAPEQGATLVLDCQAVGEGPALRLRGPGIDDCGELRVLGVDPRWWAARAAWCAFPLGVDLIICDARRIACIPRSVAVEA
jgi:alpha-D-ribose 1-methylphosphonate 5-triphosphate synthase subunit PhnH